MEKELLDQNQETSVFICYAHDDADVVHAEIEWLANQGVNRWYDEGITGGKVWREEIGDALDGADRVLFYVSKSSLASAHCNREIHYALDEDKNIIPILLDDAPLTSDLRIGLSRIQMIHKTEQTQDQYRAALMAALEASPPGSVAVAESKSRVLSMKSKRLLPLLALATIIIALGIYLGYRDSPATDPPAEAAAISQEKHSIVVLPFVNMSSDPQQEYFSDGMAEELLNLLARNSELNVISRTSAFSFKGKGMDIPAIVEKLGVDYVLEGSVRKSGNTTRITVQLIDGASDSHLWSETYDRQLDSVFAVQDEIAANVVSRLQLTLGIVPQRKPVKAKAYTLFLQARHLLGEGKLENLPRTERLINEALEIDPNYVRAWTELARLYGQQGQLGILPIEEAYRLSGAATQRALDIDPDDAVANAWLGWEALAQRNDLHTAASQYQRAIASDPTNVNIGRSFVLILKELGRIEDAVLMGEYVVARDPLCIICIDNLARAYLQVGRLKEAAATSRQSLALNPQGFLGNVILGVSLLMQHEYAAALEIFERRELPPLDQIVLYSMGRQAEFVAAFAEFRQHPDVRSIDVAMVYAWSGEVDHAFDWLDKFAEQELAGYGYFYQAILFNPLLDSLKSDSRWQAFRHKIGRSEQQLQAIEFEINIPTLRY